MSKPKKEHRPIVIKGNELLATSEKEQIIQCAKDYLAVYNSEYKEAVAKLEKSTAQYREIVGYEKTDGCWGDMDWYDTPEKWVKEAISQRKEWALQELKEHLQKSDS